ncbi:hypothetical protein RHMOL_Rhmol12G0133800 [Rhododendron molle]|uniref:Uncharacterized protein n=1 Tax=Rhododendron molle TaxID=49168 RepID=A0ACC0LIS8_RHOML|nr:hypothetical protein RHMOL_Rhmol12G0133800 [Rhododendron molle]
MSSSIGHNHQSFLAPTALEHQTKINPCCISGRNNLFQAQAYSRSRKSPISTKFWGNTLNVGRVKFPMGTHRVGSVFPRAVLAADPASEQLPGKFNLEGNITLQVDVSAPTPGSTSQINIQVTNGSGPILLHWGAIQNINEKWVLPTRHPEGTKTGSDSFLKLEIDDPSIQAIEFVIFDEQHNKWFKNDGGENFHVKLPVRNELIQPISVPEDLVQIQAYIRWERKGKPMYTPEQEKASVRQMESVEKFGDAQWLGLHVAILGENILEEYEAARQELMEEVARGTSIQDLQLRLTNKNNTSESKERLLSETKSQITEDLVQIQAYIRWEKAGKPNYSPDQQLKEFEEARKELQIELDNGTSIDGIRKKITKGEIQTKVTKQREKKYFTVGRIQRKKRDLMELLNKHSSGLVEEKISPVSVKPKVLSTIERFAQEKQEQGGSPITNKKIFRLADKELLVLVMKTAGKTKVQLATDIKGPVTLHWALSKQPGEWLVPPPTILPPGSASLDKACETQFVSIPDDQTCKVQSLEIEIEDDGFVGMPFVLLSDGKWIKNDRSDFYVEFSAEPKQAQKDAGDGQGTAKFLLDKIADRENEAQKSFMHRFNIAADLVDEAKDAGELGFAGILVWMRFMATRQLIWNKNYNVKPREISRAQDRLTDLIQRVYGTHPQHRELLRMILSTVGRGGEGDVGQRIRDEILVIQRNNDFQGGMMEEWHQKLHNNTSPDDVVICQALIDYIKSDFDVSVYWKTLKENGITKERLLSYDRGIHSEPKFSRDQKDSLLRDLGNYLRTLKAVHSGADLESAISNCMGYRAEGQGFMVGVQINPISGLPSGFPGLLEAREEIRPLLFKPNDRLRDLLFLDIALDSSVRTAVERGYEELNSAEPEKIIYFITLVLENLALSSDENEDLLYCLKGWNQALSMLKDGESHWALYAKSVLDRSRLALANKAERYHHLLQPSAQYLGSRLGVDQWAVNIFTEEIIRAGSAASLSSLLNRLDPILRKTANLGSWQVISPVEAVGYVVVVDELLAVQNKSYAQPTILVAKSVKGEEEIPDGAVAVLTPDMPDVLSHVSVRARNCKVPNIKISFLLVDDLSKVEGNLTSSSSANFKEGPLPSLKLVRKKFGGKYAISSDEFTNEMVGAKSRNIAYLKGKVPSWVGIPTSVALPFGVFEKVLSNDLNQKVAEKLQFLKKKLEGDVSALGEIRKTVLELVAPSQLVQELKNKMQSSGMPWPGDEGQQRWEQAWMAIKKVWASKWNERAYFSTRKVKLDHDYLCMAVLVQEIINADYAFVIHTTNPSSEDSSEIYVEVVKGLGETLVGAYPGRALSFVCKKSDLNSPQVLGYPSKPVGLFIRQSIIFRSDSNGEDLEGYAGAGLYDSVPIDEEEKVVLDYSSDPLIMDAKFQQSILSSIARAGSAIEELYGYPQDIEGVVRDGKIYVVQTRPQM